MLGYRTGEVDAACEAMEGDLGRSAESVRSGEAKVARLEAELATASERSAQQLHSLAVVGRQLDELRIGARGQATRIRLQALREAASVSARLADVVGAEPGADRDRLLDALEGAIDRVASEWEAEAPMPPLSRTKATTIGPGGSGNGRRAGHHRVSVDVGPFEDFSQLVRFEDAANAIGATGDISIKRFSEGRARIDVALSEPVDLLRELEERCDLEFKVRSAADDEIILDF